jgi:CHAT domain-containing protein
MAPKLTALLLRKHGVLRSALYIYTPTLITEIRTPKGIELAIFITCHSGIGETKNEEGVFGLCYALAIAGAKYVVTSL